MPEAVSENCLVALRFSKNLNALLFRCSMNVSSRIRLRGGFRCFEGHFHTRWCLRHVFCGVMHHCVVRRSGSVPTEIAEPPGGSVVQPRIHRNMQSKDFSENLTICVNFQITAFWFHILPGAKITIQFPGHKKCYGRTLAFGVGSFCYLRFFFHCFGVIPFHFLKVRIRWLQSAKPVS